ncbi:SnoaL-like polyketide cyclase [Seinonella peptonophila]|uniref:SnoaL-like polyketide cyclase n=1 Tax=Seinonella peptonophila TaxID=112248 RepID=A0A1M4X2S0_9BACL|nr:ester cyclase [Seinonella peptonophila]SHE87502.1 SnoaL-like polyketide cyclase [Seinonella peptonophila]
MQSIEQKNSELVTQFIENVKNQTFLNRTEQSFAPQMAKSFTDQKYTIDEILAQGEKVIARTLITAIHSGLFDGHEPTGKTVQITQFHEFQLLAGEIVKHYAWFDTATLLPQLQAE